MIINMLSTEESVQAALKYTKQMICNNGTPKEYIRGQKNKSHNKTIDLLETLGIMHRLGVINEKKSNEVN